MPDPEDIGRLLSDLRAQISALLADLPMLKAHGGKDPLDAHLLDRLTVAVENAKGCVLLAEAGLAIPLLTVGRSLFESLIASYWTSLSESNARVIIDAPRRKR